MLSLRDTQDQTRIKRHAQDIPACKQRNRVVRRERGTHYTRERYTTHTGLQQTHTGLQATACCSAARKLGIQGVSTKAAAELPTACVSLFLHEQPTNLQAKTHALQGTLVSPGRPRSAHTSSWHRSYLPTSLSSLLRLMCPVRAHFFGRLVSKNKDNLKT